MYAVEKTSSLLVALCCLAGCTKTIEVRRYPTFYTPDLKSVAVLPFDNETLDTRAGQFLTDRLVKSLRMNGTYKIAGPHQLAARLGDKELKRLPPDDTQAAAKLLGKLDDTQAFIIGTVTTFTSAGYSYRWRNRGYGYSWYVQDPYWHYPIDYYSHNEGRVRTHARMVLVSNGSIVSETAMHTAQTVFSDGDPPFLTRDECLIKAAGQVVDKLVEQFAVVRKRVAVPLDQALRTADGRDGDKWRLTDRFDADGRGVHAVVSLPPACDGNLFRLEITQTGRDDVLLGREFVWSDRRKEYELLITPRELAPAPSGRTFVITLYSDSEPIVSRKITIK